MNNKHKLLHITTAHVSLHNLFQGQAQFIQKKDLKFDVILFITVKNVNST